MPVCVCTYYAVVTLCLPEGLQRQTVVCLVEARLIVVLAEVLAGTIVLVVLVVVTLVAVATL
jgi:hypothetical protein